MHGQECGDAPKRGSAPQRELCHQPIALHEPWKEIPGSAAQPLHIRSALGEWLSSGR